MEGCIRFVESLGLQVKEYPSARLKEDYLAGTDKQRAADINKALRDEKIKAILAIGGGYGSSRLLPLIDWKAAAKSRKLFAGFSDITSLIGGFAAQAGLATLHAPTPSYFLRRPRNGRGARGASPVPLPALEEDQLIRGCADPPSIPR